jgi:hypothetical protein
MHPHMLQALGDARRRQMLTEAAQSRLAREARQARSGTRPHRALSLLTTLFRLPLRRARREVQPATD